ncbi:ParB/RepB/Spo0J family partition protein [Deinococcus radiomollis]|uniref:ParB/RepB/Spo0J family partition protein n=1 Tax=Deinococcus radiomollis TaxID=468916 RepID=UPI0038918A96
MTASRVFARPVQSHVAAGNGLLGDPLKLPFARILQDVRNIRVSQAYRMLVTCGACSLTLGQQEDLYLSTIKGLDRHDLDTIVASFHQLVIDMDDRPYTDLLGPLYMEIGHRLDKQARGEFFTPRSVSRLMAQMTFGPDARADFPLDQPLTCQEPACGTGGMILTAAEVLAEQGISPLHTRWVAQDISETSCYACFINLTLWSIPAQVVCGNTLSQDVRWSWTNPLWPLAVPLPQPTPDDLVERQQTDRLASLMRQFLNDLDPTDSKETTMTATTNTAATEAPAKRKPGRPKKQVEAPVVSEVAASVPVDTAVPVQAAPILEGSKITSALLTSLHASPLNPRKHFDQAKIEGLAGNILQQGLMQNLVVRLGDQPSTYEVIAGGRRLKALQHLAATGQIPPLYDVPIRLAALTDLEALQLATAENVERQSMTPMEEADAFLGMVELGAGAEDIAVKFARPVAYVKQRLTLARALGDDARTLLDAHEITLGQAQVIALTAGPMRSHVVAAAKRGATPAGMRNMVKEGSFLVANAKFDVAASGLEIVQDLFGDTPERFADPQAALALQIEWIEARAEKLRAKGKHHFVEVRSSETYLNLGYYEFDTHTSHKELAGIVLQYSTVTGELKEHAGVARQADVTSKQRAESAAKKAATASEATGSTGGAIRKAGWIDGHAARAVSIRDALLGDHKRGVALTLLGMLGGDASKLRVDWSSVEVLDVPAVRDRLTVLDHKLGGLLGVKAIGDKYARCPIQGDRFSGNWRDRDSKEFAFYTTLMDLELGELLDLQGILISCTLANWSIYQPEGPVAEFVTRLGEDVNARPVLLLTDAHLKAYTRDRLIELAKDAGLDHAAMAKLGTSKLIREAILAHADELFEQGYVPAIARFPEPLPPLPAAEAAKPGPSDEDGEEDEDLDEEGSEDDAETDD